MKPIFEETVYRFRTRKIIRKNIYWEEPLAGTSLLGWLLIALRVNISSCFKSIEFDQLTNKYLSVYKIQWRDYMINNDGHLFISQILICFTLVSADQLVFIQFWRPSLNLTSSGHSFILSCNFHSVARKFSPLFDLIQVYFQNLEAF